jgi:hypothetical protein
MTKSAETPPVPVEKHKQSSLVESPEFGALEVPLPVSAMKRKRSSPEPRLEKRVTHHRSDRIPTIDLTSEPAVTKRPKAKSVEIRNVKEVSVFTVQSASRLYDTARLRQSITY